MRDTIGGRAVAQVPRDRKREFHTSKARPAFVLPAFGDIPNDMTAARRWVAWRPEWRAGRGGASGKWTKVPINCFADDLPPSSDGGPRKASSTYSQTWCGIDRLFWFHMGHVENGSEIDGIGFVLGDGWAGIDLDNARDPDTGTVAAWALKLIERCGSYAEVSPSGTGVKVFGRGRYKGKEHRRSGYGGPGTEIEVYSDGRFFAVTGRPVGTPRAVADIQPVLDELAAELGGLKAERPAVTAAPPPPAVPSLADAEIIDIIRRSKQRDEFAALFDRGDTSGHGGDHSRADQALCNILAFYCGTPARADALFRRSALMRPKWDESRGEATYGQRTVATAFEGRTAFYTGKGSRMEQCEVPADFFTAATGEAAVSVAVPPTAETAPPGGPATPPPAGQPVTIDPSRHNVSADDPAEIARGYVAAMKSSAGLPTLAYWRQACYRWSGAQAVWAKLDDDAIRLDAREAA